MPAVVLFIAAFEARERIEIDALQQANRRRSCQSHRIARSKAVDTRERVGANCNEWCLESKGDESGGGLGGISVPFKTRRDAVGNLDRAGRVCWTLEAGIANHRACLAMHQEKPMAPRVGVAGNAKRGKEQWGDPSDMNISLRPAAAGTPTNCSKRSGCSINARIWAGSQGLTLRCALSSDIGDPD